MMDKSPVAAVNSLEKWRWQLMEAGFSLQEANRLAFWRWLATRRGETCRRGLAVPV
jgi:hypothetical protein